MRPIFYILFLINTFAAFGQDMSPDVLSYREYLGYVKKYHPVVRQAGLQISMAEAGLMMARGGFDPKIEVDYNTKEFKNKDYYSLLNSSFKIPTWYGVEIKAAFDNSEGMYVNPQNTMPDGGLTSLGISVPLGQGLLINSRMADVRKARAQIALSNAERQIQAANVIHDASIAYFNWKRAHNEVRLYEDYLSFAQVRLSAVKRLIELGDKPAIDSVEAIITVRNRDLNLEEARLKLVKAKLEASNFIWLENVPMELEEGIVPEESLFQTVKQTLNVDRDVYTDSLLSGHPKIVGLETKLDILNIDRQLKANMLLPKIDIGYHLLNEPSYGLNPRINDYKASINFSLPIFLRKERGTLKLAKLKIADAQFELDIERTQIRNKILSQKADLASLDKQLAITGLLVNDYSKMLQSEERLFSMGESSIFFINSRENALINTRLSQISLEYRQLASLAMLFNIFMSFDNILINTIGK